MQEVCGILQCSQSHTVCALSHSPSPGSTDCEENQPTQAPGESQYTYKYEMLNHEGLINCMQEEFGLDIHG
ncbi:hypothetical protein FRC11_007987, partial [Ceratobasidium sp. 423]